MRRTINLGTGNLEWGGNGEGLRKGGGQFTSNLRPRWTGSCHNKEGFQVSKRETKKGSKGNQQGEVKEQGDRTMYIVNLYMCI